MTRGDHRGGAWARRAGRGGTAVLAVVAMLALTGCYDFICFMKGGGWDYRVGECIGLSDSSSLAAASAGEILYLAASAHVSGALGTDWRSDVELHNLADQSASVTLWLLVHGADNSSPAYAQINVPAGSSVRLADVLAGQFSLNGQAALMLSVGSGRILATSRTYNLLAAGNPLGLPGGATFGQYIPAQGRAAAIAFGEEGRLIQLSHSTATTGGFRTNLGLVNITSASLRVEVELYDASGALLGTVPVTLPSFGYQQLNRVFAAVTSGDVTDGYAVVRTTTAGGRFFAYASVVDNLTGDPIAITAAVVPVDEPPGTGEPVYVVAAAHLSGIGGTNWRTDLELHNWGDHAAIFTIELLEHGVDNSAPSYSTSYTMAAGASLRLQDVLASAFGYSGAASVRVTPTAGHVLVTSRTYNLLGEGNDAGLPAGATFGQYIPGVTMTDAIQEGEEGRLIQLSHTPGGANGYRTNLVLVNAVATAIEVEVGLYSSDGTLLGTTTRTLAPFEYRQLNGVFEMATAATVADGYAVARTTTSGGALFALASVVDNLTGDPVGLSAAVVLPAAAEGVLGGLERTMEVLGGSTIESTVDGIQTVGVDAMLDTLVSAQPGVAQRTSDGFVIDYGEGAEGPDGALWSGAITAAVSGTTVNAGRISGTLTLTHDSLLVDGEPPAIGPTRWTVDLAQQGDGRVVGEILVGAAGASASTATESLGNLTGRLEIDTLVCRYYPVGGSLTLDLADETITITFDGRCDGGFDSSVGGPPVEPEGDLLAVEWSFTGDTSTVGTIDSSDGSWQVIGSSGFPRLNSLARSPSGIYYSVTEYDTGGAKRLITVNPGNGAGTVVGQVTGIPDEEYISGLAFSPAGTLYAVISNNIWGTKPASELYTMDPSSGAATPVGSIAGFTYVLALDFDDATGTLYGWDHNAGLLTIDPASGAGSDVNSSVAGPTMMSIVVLPNGAMVGGQHALYSIDKATGEATQMGAATLNNVRGMEVLDSQ